MASGPSQAELDAHNAQQTANTQIAQNAQAGNSLLGAYAAQNSQLGGTLSNLLNQTMGGGE